MASGIRIVVTGAGGMLGSDVVRAGERAGHDILALTRAQLDIRDPDAVNTAVADARPAVIVNCAAYTDVDGAEADRDGTLAVNAEGARNVARAAADAGASVVYPSTDYVFPGDQAARPYVESDPTGPRSVYGESKLAGELATADATPRHLLVRTSWLFGHAGRNFVETMLRLADKRDELTVVVDQKGCPTYTAHLAAAMIALIEAGSAGIRHLSGAGSASWYQFAVEIIRRSGASCAVRPCTTAEFPRPAPRPAYSVLASELPDTPQLPDWRVGLDEYLSARVAAR
ncbi:MAG: dTDP-4-dehydrorhamnose reductase [Thermoleophilaceae bacterium]